MGYSSFEEWYDQLTKRKLVNEIATWCRNHNTDMPRRIEKMSKGELWKRFFWAKQEWHRELVPHVNTLWKPVVTGIDYLPEIRDQALRAYINKAEGKEPDRKAFSAETGNGRWIRKDPRRKNGTKASAAKGRPHAKSTPPKAQGRKEVPKPAERPAVGRKWKPVSKEALATVVPDARVTSPVLGEGTVVAVDARYLEVRFPDRQCRFVMPDAFEYGYLKLPEPEA